MTSPSQASLPRDPDPTDISSSCGEPAPTSPPSLNASACSHRWSGPNPQRCERVCRGGHFTYHDSRDLFGFVDGTENPSPDEAPEVALLADGPGAGGSFGMIQRWVHHRDNVLALPVPEQEFIVGRTKVDDGVPDRLMSFSTPSPGQPGACRRSTW